ncbi:alpha-E domain-containing protein [Marinicrinis sediminis]|uniref:Alpha-E domain-containing protein n=1 Tax=Marinicrinis sediminis TaxID=1652465 RepID=A0ABW5R8X9_9BACL
MLSRAADSLFWMARNIERAENNARLIDVNLESMLENVDPSGDSEGDNWEAILRINGYVQPYYQLYECCNTRDVMNFVTFSTDNPNSILQSVEIARENARTIRGIIPQELWELLNSFFLRMKEYPVKQWEMDSIHQFFQMVKDQSLHFQGIVDAIMFRGDAYTFIKLGKWLERAEKTARILDIYYHKKPISTLNPDIVEHHNWWSVLHMSSGYEAYLEQYRSYLKPEKVVEFLLFNETFPRSIRYCIEQLMLSFDDLEQGKIQPYNRSLYIELGKLHAYVKYGSVEEVIQIGAHEYFRMIQKSCNQIGQLIRKTYYLGEIDG